MNNFGYILKSNGLKQLINSRFPSVKLVPRKTRHVTLSRFQYEIGWVLGPCVYLQERVMPASQLHVLSILISCQYEDEIHRLSIIQLGKKKSNTAYKSNQKYWCVFPWLREISDPVWVKVYVISGKTLVSWDTRLRDEGQQKLADKSTYNYLK